MHKHPRTNKRKVIALRFFIYGVMTLATMVISAVSILLVMGYQFDLNKRTLEQGGLLQLRSFPNGATIGLDGGTLSFKTPGRRSVEAGTHTVTMSLAGYRPWAKTVDIHPGELHWLNYTRFVPESITTTGVREFASLASILPSPDRDSILLLPSAAKPEFTLTDISNEVQPEFETLRLPAAAYTSAKPGQTHRFSLHEWDFGSRYVIVKHTVGSTTEFIRLDTRDVTRSINISKTLGITIRTLHFSGTNGNLYYAVDSGGALRRVDVGAKTISSPLAQNVLAVSMYGERTIAYTAKAAGQYVAGLYHDERAVELAKYDAKQPLSVAVTEYFNRIYVAVARGKEVAIFVNPHTVDNEGRKASRTLEMKHPVAWVDLSNNGRFLVAGNGSQFTTYDIEKKESFSATLPKARTKNVPFAWLDDFYFVSTGGSDLRVAEFDGTNQQFITDVAPGFQATLSANGEALYSVARLENGRYVLQRSQMVTD